MRRPRDNRRKVPQSEIIASRYVLETIIDEAEITRKFMKTVGLETTGDKPLRNDFVRLWLAGYQWMPRKRQWIEAKKSLAERAQEITDVSGSYGPTCDLCDSRQLSISVKVDGRRAYFCIECVPSLSGAGGLYSGGGGA